MQPVKQVRSAGSRRGWIAYFSMHTKIAHLLISTSSLFEAGKFFALKLITPQTGFTKIAYPQIPVLFAGPERRQHPRLLRSRVDGRRWHPVRPSLPAPVQRLRHCPLRLLRKRSNDFGTPCSLFTRVLKRMILSLS